MAAGVAASRHRTLAAAGNAGLDTAAAGPGAAGPNGSARTASLEQLDQQIAAHCGQLQASLEVMLPSPSGRGAGGEGRADRAIPSSLDALLARGDFILEQIKETTESRRQWEREKSRLAKAATEAESKASHAEADLNEWQAQWTAAIQPLGLPGASTPAAVNEVVAQTAELFSRLKESAGFAERIDGIGREGLRFRAEAERLLRAIDPDCPVSGDHLQEALEDVVVRLRRAIVDQKKRDLLQSQRTAAGGKAAAGPHRAGRVAGSACRALPGGRLR